MAQVQKDKQASKVEEKPAEKKAEDLKPKGDEIKAKADEIADMIDDVLQDNAEQFIKAYVQRGGE